MIIFASFLQYFRLQHSHGLSEHPAGIMDRLVDTAVRLGMLPTSGSILRMVADCHLVTTNETIVVCMYVNLAHGGVRTHSANL